MKGSLGKESGSKGVRSIGVKGLLLQILKAQQVDGDAGDLSETQKILFFIPGTTALSASPYRSLEGRAYRCPWVQQRQLDLVWGDG